MRKPAGVSCVGGLFSPSGGRLTADVRCDFQRPCACDCAFCGWVCPRSSPQKSQPGGSSPEASFHSLPKPSPRQPRQSTFLPVIPSAGSFHL
jgi:hypothetical protein